jgi:hypothetical protein
MELTQGSETSANYNYNMTPGKYPKEHIQYSKHGESLKSTTIFFYHKHIHSSAVLENGAILSAEAHV